MIKLFCMVYNLEYTDFKINIAKSFHKLRNDKYFADITFVTEDDIQVRAPKIIPYSLKVIVSRHMKKFTQEL